MTPERRLSFRPLALLVALAVPAAVSACGGDELDAEFTDESALEQAEEALAIGFNPGDAPPVVLEAEPIPQEIPVCNDCLAAGSVRLVQTAAGANIVLTGVPVGVALGDRWGVSRRYTVVEDRLYIAEHIGGGTYARTSYWVPIGAWSHRNWTERQLKSGAWDYRDQPGENTGTFSAAAVALPTGLAGVTNAANWQAPQGGNPRFRAEVMAIRSDRLVGVTMAVPFTP